MVFCGLTRFILFIAILKICTVHNAKTQPRSQSLSFDFSSEDVDDNTSSDEQHKPKATHSQNKLALNIQENSQESLAHIVEEVGSSRPKKVYRKDYNESAATRICWKTITYVKESNVARGERFPWREYEVIFDSPSDDNSGKIVGNHSKVLSYKLRDPETGTTELLNFTVIEKNTEFTLSKHEKLTCGSGHFLSKVYYEWPRSNKKRVVVKLSDQPSDLADEEDNEELLGPNLGNKSGNVVKSEELTLKYEKNADGGPPRPSFYNEYDIFLNEHSNGKNGTNSGVNKGVNSSNKIKPLSADIYHRPLTDSERSNISAQHRKPNNTKGDRFHSKNPVETVDDDIDLTVGAAKPVSENQSPENASIEYDEEDIFVAPEAKISPGAAAASSKGSTSIADPCGPMLTSLLSENGLIPGLCSLRKNEKVVLKGDITVSKKYLDKENTEITEALYVIQENTEIKAVQGKPEK